MLEILKHQQLEAWIHSLVELMEPRRVHLCTGGEQEVALLSQELVHEGKLIALNPEKRPASFLARSHPKDVARSEQRTFICSSTREEAGPTNNWKAPEQMLSELQQLFKGCMHGRTLYVIPFSMGPLGSPMSQIGVQITDSAYVVCSMRIMTRMGGAVLALLGEEGRFIPCVHSMGVPLKLGEKDLAWPCNPESLVIAHFPQTREIWSFGSGYGGNALLGKKALALRIGSVMGKEEGWLAEHMLLIGVTNPEGVKKYIAAAFPSACGKTNLAMLQATLPGWKVECVGDDIAWMRLGADGRLYAINPEAGFFGVAPGTSMRSNPNALLSCRSNSLFTNVALTADGDIWWEGLTETPPSPLYDWQGNPWTLGTPNPAAHPNSRFTAPAAQCPAMDPRWEAPEGVPLSAIIFGGRRSTTVPLVYEAFSWEHGILLGAALSSETTAAVVGEIGQLRHDPFAMLAFCGYHMGDYFSHWLQFAHRTSVNQLPKIFCVNWFRKEEGKFLWPGYGENIRVLKWICERLEGKAAAVNTPLGWLPEEKDFDLGGLSLSLTARKNLFKIDRQEWLQEVAEIRRYLAQFEPRLPQEMKEQLTQLEERLKEKV